MNKESRAKMILAMEYIARCINDENVLDCWLMYGVADGDIPDGCMDVNKVDECYLTDDNFKDIMSCFLRRMNGAYNSGGLHCDKIVSDYKGRN